MTVRTLEQLIEDGTIWIDDGQYVARDSDGVISSLWSVNWNEDGFRKALADGYGEFNK